ncbi:Transposon Ty3-I Gag-Pol polyprotein [Cucumis melo var. makuwa]|uniref:Transposon Ty3-I Gag-Pol polyprotein n=1 Tax=Cucumis melo var. makuwa TaxID=1194695 RepID=A0A5D3E571_CUCMM|nr:Transposon Ty3-I Gag-Pol polyprotein [Cucumis melo var. makuwa]TYK30938.1 Transposon Ty3-I Gag-Pol polyprotein [Cucumis melo var. makuwa]
MNKNCKLDSISRPLASLWIPLELWTKASLAVWLVLLEVVSEVVPSKGNDPTSVARGDVMLESFNTLTDMGEGDDWTLALMDGSLTPLQMDLNDPVKYRSDDYCSNSVGSGNGVISNVEPSVQSNWFTWTSKVHGFSLLHRLDRILMNENWFSTWPSSRIRFLPRGDGPFQALEKVNNNAYKIDLPGEYSVSSAFNTAYLSPFDVGDEFLDLRKNPFKEGENDENHGVPLVPEGPITRSKALKIQ